MGSDTSPQGCQAEVLSNTQAPTPLVSEGVRLDHGISNVLFNYPPYYTCQFVVANASGNDYFLPQATKAEFLSFLTASPPGVSFANCVMPISYTATPSAPYAAYSITAEGGAITEIGTTLEAPITNIQVPTNQAVDGGVMQVPATTTVNVVNSSTMAPIQFYYTRSDCATDPYITPPPCNTWIVRETQSVFFTAPTTVGMAVNGSWLTPSNPPVVTSTYAISTSMGGPWTPVTVNGVPGGTPGIYNNDFQPPALTGCTSGGVTYDDGQTWTAPVNSTQPPTAAECPSGAGTRIDQISTPTNYICNAGTANIQSTGAPTEVGFTGSCGSAPPVTTGQGIYVVDTDNNRVEVFDMTGTFKFTFGSTGTGNGQFTSTPWAIRTDSSGNLLVTDDANGRVEQFDPNGNYMSQFSVAGTPDMAAVAPNGNIWVTGVNNGTLNEFSSTQAPMTSYSGFAYPIGVAFDSSGNVWLSDNNVIKKISPSGALLTSFGSAGTGTGQFQFPWGIAVDPATQNVWVADRDNNRIQVFNSSGTFLFTFGSPGTGNGQFNWPIDLAFDPQGNVWVTDMQNNRVQEFDTSGNYKMQFGTLGTGNGQFHLPIGITIANSAPTAPTVCTSAASTPPSSSTDWDGAPSASYVSGEALPIGNPPNFTQFYLADLSQPLDATWTLMTQAPSPPPAGSTYASTTPSACTTTGGAFQLQTALQGGGNYTSCEIENYTYAQTYGKYLIRFRADDLGPGISPIAFLYTPTTGSDYMIESWGGAPQGYLVTQSGVGTTTPYLTQNFTTQWHTMGVEWTPGSIVYTLDGVVYSTVTDPGVPSTPSGITLTQELNTISGTTPAVSNFDINWIAVYSYTPGSAGTCSGSGGGGSCTVGGVTYVNGATWTGPVNSTQAPTALECPSGAGSRIDDMQSTVTYVCNNGTVNTQSSTAPVETGHTGSCPAPSGTIYVCDTADGVDSFDMNGNYLGNISTPCWNVAVDNSGNLLVTNPNTSAVESYTTAGGLLSQFQLAGYTTPDFAVTAPNGDIWVSGVFNSTMNVFSPAESQLFVQPGFSAPVGEAFDPSGYLWVVDGNSVKKLDSSANVLLTVGSFGNGNGQFEGPWGVAVDPANGNVWVADRNNNRVQVFNNAGTFLFTFGTSGTGNGQFNQPMGIAVDPSGNVWVADSLNNRIQEFTTSGVYENQFSAHVNTPYGVAFHP